MYLLYLCDSQDARSGNINELHVLYTSCYYL